jgi:hypothetical protein
MLTAPTALLSTLAVPGIAPRKICSLERRRLATHINAVSDLERSEAACFSFVGLDDGRHK